VILEPVVAEGALPHSPIVLALVEDAERTGGDAIAAAIAYVLLNDHGPELGPEQRTRGADVQTGSVGAVLAHVGGHQPTQPIALLIGLDPGVDGAVRLGCA